MVRAGALVVPLINLLREELLERPYLLMDETTVQVLKEPGKGAQSKSQLWAQMSAGPEPPIVVFDSDPTRAGDVPKRLLAGFTGALHTDGYSGCLLEVREQGLVHLACWAHARRGFTDTLKSLGLNPNMLPPAPPAKARRALSVLHRIRTLYAIERRIRDTPPDQRHRARQAESVPVLNALRAWLDDTLPKGLPSGPLARPCATSTTSGTRWCASVTTAATASTPTPSRTPSARSASEDATGCSPIPWPAPTPAPGSTR